MLLIFIANKQRNILSENSFVCSAHFLLKKKTFLKQSAALNIYLLTNGINVSTTDFVWSCNICYQMS